MLVVPKIDNPWGPDRKGAGAKSVCGGEQDGGGLPWDKDGGGHLVRVERCPGAWLEEDSWSTLTRFLDLGPQFLDQHV